MGLVRRRLQLAGQSLYAAEFKHAIKFFYDHECVTNYRSTTGGAGVRTLTGDARALSGSGRDTL